MPKSGRERDRIPVTSVPRTLLDRAVLADGHAVERALEEADRPRVLESAPIDALLKRRRGQPGTRRLAEALGRHREPELTRSELENRFIRLCGQAGLPAPAVNTPVAGLEVDAFWPHRRLVVELDGYAYHRGRAAFERDRTRDARLRLAGYEVLRFSYSQVAQHPESVADVVAAALR